MVRLRPYTYTYAPYYYKNRSFQCVICTNTILNHQDMGTLSLLVLFLAALILTLIPQGLADDFYKPPVYKRPVYKPPVYKHPIYKPPVHKPKPPVYKPPYKKPPYKKPPYGKHPPTEDNIHV
ncbi:hypothetical protein VNO77_26772 [Canavalia gladiata]|uniref:Uncharacterized protein n=1 Tax=Canavalia gladiata TaxID=3824 RepID=A0AAN9KSY8_CANGL